MRSDPRPRSQTSSFCDVIAQSMDRICPHAVRRLQKALARELFPGRNRKYMIAIADAGIVQAEGGDAIVQQEQFAVRQRVGEMQENIVVKAYEQPPDVDPAQG